MLEIRVVSATAGLLQLTRTCAVWSLTARSSRALAECSSTKRSHSTSSSPSGSWSSYSCTTCMGVRSNLQGGTNSFRDGAAGVVANLVPPTNRTLHGWAWEPTMQELTVSRLLAHLHFWRAQGTVQVIMVCSTCT